MAEISQKTLDEKFKTLPEKLKQALDSDRIEDISLNLAEKYDLPGDAADVLEDAITLVLMGLSDPKDFTRNIARDIKIDATKATASANEVNEKVFKPVKDDLMKLYGQPATSFPTTSLDEFKKRLAGEDASFSTEVPKPKPLAKELEETVGLGRSEEVVEKIKTYPKDVEKALHQKASAAPEPKAQTPETPMPSPPPPPVSMHKWMADDVLPPQPPKKPTVPKPADNQVEPDKPPFKSWAQKTSQPNVNWPQPAPQTFKPRKEPLPDNYKVFAESEPESEEGLDREEILRGIENPSTIKMPPKPSNPRPASPSPQPTGGYTADPYREPAE